MCMQLEYLSIAGFMFVLMLLFTMIVESCMAGLPAISDGEFSVVGFSDICARICPRSNHRFISSPSFSLVLPPPPSTVL